MACGIAIVIGVFLGGLLGAAGATIFINGRLYR